MASTGKSYVDQFTINNQGIMDLRELLFLTVLQMGSINETLDLMTGIVPGSRLGGIGEMEPVGLPANGCNPQWNASKIATLEKIWELGAYEVAEKICYQDLEETLVQFSMRRGTNRADLTGTDYMDIIVEPTLRQALEKMVWRLLWFGNKSASNVDDGGQITDGINSNLFVTCDGLFKRLFDITALDSSLNVPIAANTAASYAAQIAGIRADGVATSIFDTLIYDAPMRLRQKSDKLILTTQTLADALAGDIKRNNKGSELQWQSLFDGFVYATQYNGHTILSLPIWDEMIRSFEDNGTSWNKPHRAVFAGKSNLKAGVHSNNMIADLKIWFSDDDQDNKMLVRDKLGTLVWEDDLIMFGY